MNQNTVYYFVGIKGTGMSSMALMIHQLGYTVIGSDVKQTTFTQQSLINAGIKILPFNAKNISLKNSNYFYIIGNSFNTKNNAEVKAINKYRLHHCRYHQFLGKMIRGYNSVGIAGTHGKTTTTGMLSYVLKPLHNFNYLIGDGRGHAQKNAKYFVYEADEYRDHYLATYPRCEILNNCDFDHVDYFHNVKNYIKSFQKFASHAQDFILLWGESKRLKLIKNVKAKIYKFGTKPDDNFRAINIKRNTKGSEFTVQFQKHNLGTFKIQLFGKYNILHALAVIAYCFLQKVNPNIVRKRLATYQGEKRRFTHYHIQDMEIIDDYAHVPNEIKATLGEARQQYPNKKLIVVFQPHTYSRVKAFLKGFGKSLSLADVVYVTKIFGSPREKSGKVTSQDIVNQITKPSAIIHGEDMKPLLKYHHQVVIFMGAGDIPKYEKQYAKLLNQRK